MKKLNSCCALKINSFELFQVSEETQDKDNPLGASPCRLKEQPASAGWLAVSSSHAGKATCWFANASSRSHPTPLVGVGSSWSHFPTPGSCEWVVCALGLHLC